VLDMDGSGLRCRAVSEVKEVLHLNFQGADPFEPGKVEVCFRTISDGVANAVCWFWLAELDAETALTNAPCSLVGTGEAQTRLKWALQRAGESHWKQALQMVGPVSVRQDDEVRSMLNITDSALTWTLRSSVEEAERLLAGRNSTELFAEYRAFLTAWAAVQRESLAEREQYCWKQLSREVPVRRQQLQAALEFLSQACEFQDVVGCPSWTLLPRLFQGIRA